MPTVPDLPTKPTTEKLSRRQRLAEVVLTNAPMPHRIGFTDPDRPGEVGDKLTLTFNNLADLRQWAALFLPDVEVNPGFYDPDDRTIFASISGQWGGYPLSLYARWPASPPPEPLDRDQYDQLLAIANAPGEAPLSGGGQEGGASVAADAPPVDPDERCRRCGRQFDPTDRDPAGAARYNSGSFCCGCIDRCHESTDAFHVCPVCAPPVDCCPDAPDAEVTEVGGETVEDAEVAP